MIADRDTVKKILGITDTANDNLIDLLIPMVSGAIFEYCNNYFVFGEKLLVNASLSGNTITVDTDISYLFNRDVNILGSRFNDGNYTIITQTSNSISVLEALADESDVSIYLGNVVYPAELSLILAKMIDYDINADNRGVQSEKVYNYSVSYALDGSYPKNIIAKLDKYKLLKGC